MARPYRRQDALKRGPKVHQDELSPRVTSKTHKQQRPAEKLRIRSIQEVYDHEHQGI
jgi:hypothetical protein